MDISIICCSMPAFASISKAAVGHSFPFSSLWSRLLSKSGRSASGPSSDGGGYPGGRHAKKSHSSNNILMNNKSGSLHYDPLLDDERPLPNTYRYTDDTKPRNEVISGVVAKFGSDGSPDIEQGVIQMSVQVEQTSRINKSSRKDGSPRIW